MLEQIVRGPLLIPRADGSVTFHFDGILAADAGQVLRFAGSFEEFHNRSSNQPTRLSDGVMLPPLLDIHIHIPQHPIRGRFTEGIANDAKEGKLLAGLRRNVFPAEAKCATEAYAEQVVREFLADTLSHGVVGGSAYMTPSAVATEVALSMLPESWSVGLVLMNQNCPQDLRRRADARGGHQTSGNSVWPPPDRHRSLRGGGELPPAPRASALAGEYGLRTQTHLNEQSSEKTLVENVLYPGCANYTDIYRADGLLDHRCILAHCIHMTDDEWRIARDSGSVIAHCPTSNTLLGSGIMSLDEVARWNVPYAIATDVGASPTVSMLAEMRRFIDVHAGRSDRGTASEALYRSTRAPADLLDMGTSFGSLEQGFPMSFIEVASSGLSPHMSADAAIRSLLPIDPNHPATTVSRVTLAGRCVFSGDNGATPARG